METSKQPSEAWASPPAENRPPTGVLASSRILRPRDLQRYRACENGTAGLIYFMVVFSPWAFGTTQPWAIRTMDVAGYLLGLLLALKLWVRWQKGYRPARWGRKTRTWREKQKVESRKQKATAKAGLRDHKTTGLRDHGTTGLRKHKTTGLRDHKTTRLREHGTTGLWDTAIGFNPAGGPGLSGGGGAGKGGGGNGG